MWIGKNLVCNQTRFSGEGWYQHYCCNLTGTMLCLLIVLYFLIFFFPRQSKTYEIKLPLLNVTLKDYSCADLPAQTTAKVFLLTSTYNFFRSQEQSFQTYQSTELLFRCVLLTRLPYAGELYTKAKYLSQGSLLALQNLLPILYFILNKTEL